MLVEKFFNQLKLSMKASNSDDLGARGEQGSKDWQNYNRWHVSGHHYLNLLTAAGWEGLEFETPYTLPDMCR